MVVLSKTNSNLIKCFPIFPKRSNYCVYASLFSNSISAECKAQYRTHETDSQLISEQNIWRYEQHIFSNKVFMWLDSNYTNFLKHQRVFSRITYIQLCEMRKGLETFQVLSDECLCEGKDSISFKCVPLTSWKIGLKVCSENYISENYTKVSLKIKCHSGKSGCIYFSFEEYFLFRVGRIRDINIFLYVLIIILTEITWVNRLLSTKKLLISRGYFPFTVKLRSSVQEGQ